MYKSEAIELLGGTAAKAAEAIGVTPSALSQWPDDKDLPPRLLDRVQAALYRRAQAEKPNHPAPAAEAA